MKNKKILNFFRNLSLDKKFAAAITACVILSIAALTILIVRRETILLESDNRRNAEILAASISTALKDNMLGGRPKETVRLIKELSGIKWSRRNRDIKAGRQFCLRDAGACLRPQH